MGKGRTFATSNNKTTIKMENSIKLTAISVEQAINHANKEYNPLEWKKQIIQLTKWFSDVNFYEFQNDVYSIYNSNGITSITKMEYITSLNNGGLKSYILKDNQLTEYPITISKSKQDLDLAKFLSTQGLVFASVYFDI